MGLKPRSASSVSESEAIGMVCLALPTRRVGLLRRARGARVRRSPSQRQSARCARIRNFSLGEWSPRFGPGGPVLSRTAAAERSSQRPSPRGAGGRAVRAWCCPAERSSQRPSPRGAGGWAARVGPGGACWGFDSQGPARPGSPGSGRVGPARSSPATLGQSTVAPRAGSVRVWASPLVSRLSNHGHGGGDANGLILGAVHD